MTFDTVSQKGIMTQYNASQLMVSSFAFWSILSAVMNKASIHQCGFLILAYPSLLSTDSVIYCS